MATPSDIYEKLGTFYLGREYDLASSTRAQDLVLYDSKDLVTHAVIVGMTGSGKTGLGVGILEEAAIDGIPALIVDPKGDLSNLLLQFPNLDPSDFAPWIQGDDATRQGLSVEELAVKEAKKWESGLSDWDQDKSRVRRVRDAVEYTIFTPGSDAGVPISILSSFKAPPAALRDDNDLLQDRISTTATSLLALLGIDADPLRSREHILLTNIFYHAWGQGQDLDLGGIIQMVQQPPFSQIGVMDLEAFFPSKDRFELSMTLNNLLAAPGFASWLKGEPLDIDRLLFTPTGKPRHSIFSIAHLSDSERMFFMSLLLNQTLGWMRSRPGTNSLRAMLYIDEIFGYMPPVAEPPSKKPLLTLLKQARAFGLGLTLATQNPVDLDYKGLSNTGTWFLGRLQTEQDKDRVLDGLEGASAESGESFDRNEISEILSNVGKRVFLMHNVHEDRPVVFQTRWALSYLTGPLTRNQIRGLMSKRAAEAEIGGQEEMMASRSKRGHAVDDGTSEARPVLPPAIEQVFLPPRRPISSGQLAYEPQILAAVKVHFVDTRKGLSADESTVYLLDVEDNSLGRDWSDAVQLTIDMDELERSPLEPCRYFPVPTIASQAKSLTGLRKQLSEHLYRSRRFEIFKSSNLKAYSEPGESERDFRIRLSERAREERDRQTDKLRKKYASKVRTLEDRIQRAEHAVQREEQEAKSAKMQTVISFGATILGAVLGRKAVSSTNVGRAATAARGVGRMSKQTDDIRRAEEKLMAYREQLEELEIEITEETDKIEAKLDPLNEELDTIKLKPRKTDIDIRLIAVGWVPCAVDQSGEATPVL